MFESRNSDVSASEQDGDGVHAKHWASIVEAGTVVGTRLFFFFYRVFGERVCRILVRPVALYYFVRRGLARQASKEYLKNVHDFDPSALSIPPATRHSFRHFVHFANAIVDKVVVWSKTLSESELDILDRDVFETVVDSGHGKLIIGSHFGNLEYCRGFARRDRNIVLNVLIHDRHAAGFASFMNDINPLTGFNVYQVTEIDVQMILKLKAAIARGEIVVIAGDRIPVGNTVRTTSVQFLGKSARLPIGPYILASTLACPVYTLFAYRLNGRLTVAFEHFADEVRIPRKARNEELNLLAQKFAGRLEYHCLRAPYEWFNFYHFWRMDSGA